MVLQKYLCLEGSSSYDIGAEYNFTANTFSNYYHKLNETIQLYKLFVIDRSTLYAIIMWNPSPHIKKKKKIQQNPF